LSKADLKAKLLEAIALKDLARAGWVRAGVNNPESVAAHSWGVSWLVLTLCPDNLDRGRALEMAVVHDLPEVHAGDITPHDGVLAAVKTERERAAMEHLFAGYPRSDELKALWEEYEGGITPEALFVKACDKLDMALQAQWYEKQQPGTDLEEFVVSALERLGDVEIAGLI
jgi:putative hydrolase of HD superfamily